MDTKHTPLVMSVSANDCNGKPFEEACIEDVNGNIVFFSKDISLAAFIARACNEYDSDKALIVELVAALKMALPFMPFDIEYPSNGQERAIILAALAKAEGKNGDPLDTFGPNDFNQDEAEAQQ